MRDIKFRAWCNDQKRMFTKVLIGNTTNPDSDDYTAHCVFRDGNWYHSDEHDNVVFIQYIGLKDTDGCEICESDICEIMYYTPFGDKTNDFYGKWVVKNWMGQFVLVSGKERLSFIDFANSISSEYVSNLGTVLDFSEKVNVRVIGNIHQNPELLEDK